MLITLKLDCFHRKLSSYNYRMNTLTFFPLKVVLFFIDYYFICFELSTLGFQIRLMMTSQLYFCHKWLSLLVYFSPKTNLKKNLCTKIIYIIQHATDPWVWKVAKYWISKSQSSKWNAHYVAHQGRLNFQEVVEGGVARKSGSWSALISDQNQWLQVDLLRQESVITTVATQGRNRDPLWGPHNQWVKSYKLQYNNNGVDFEYHKDAKQNSAKVRLKMASIYRLSLIHI